MNERIKELADQCRESHLSNTGEWYSEFDEGKFAELIVRECSRVAKLEVGTNRVCDAIEKHFGVEE